MGKIVEFNSRSFTVWAWRRRIYRHEVAYYPEMFISGDDGQDDRTGARGSINATRTISLPSADETSVSLAQAKAELETLTAQLAKIIR